jgi:hypothetical protein
MRAGGNCADHLQGYIMALLPRWNKSILSDKEECQEIDKGVLRYMGGQDNE